MKSPTVQFYRRVLPSSCIDFTSDDGKTVFKEALVSGHMNCYFKISAQFRTQDEPAFCGLTSLVIVLNVLEVDPGKLWKGPWRWYHENMLDCCASLETAREKGITMNQFVCLAQCNSLKAQLTPATQVEVKAFRQLVKDVSARDDVVLILSYSRQVLNQTGEGHFSPLAGYHEGRDLVLILDTARFKYPPHWVPLELMLSAMKTFDADTGVSRGYVLLSRSGDTRKLLLFRPSPLLRVDVEPGNLSPMLLSFITTWNRWVEEESTVKSSREVVIVSVNVLNTILKKNSVPVSIFSLACLFNKGSSGVVCCKFVSFENFNSEEQSVVDQVKQLGQEIVNTKTYALVAESFSILDGGKELLGYLGECETSCACNMYGESIGDAALTSSLEFSDKLIHKESNNMKESSCDRLDKSDESEITKASPEKKAKVDKTEIKTNCCDPGARTEMIQISPEHTVTMFLLSWPHLSCPLQSGVDSSQSNGQFLQSFTHQDIQNCGELLKKELDCLSAKFIHFIKYHCDHFK